MPSQKKLSTKAIIGLIALGGLFSNAYAAPLNRITEYIDGTTSISDGLELNGAFNLLFSDSRSIGSGTIGVSGVDVYSIVPDLNEMNNLTFSGGATLSSGIGLSGSGINQIVLNGVSGSLVSIGGPVFSNSISITNEAYLEVSGPATGELFSARNGRMTFSDNVNASAISLDYGFVHLNGESTVADINYGGDGFIYLNTILNGNVSNISNVDRSGTIELYPNAQIDGNVGGSGASLKFVFSGADSNNLISGDLFSEELSLSGNAILSISGQMVSETVNFSGLGSLSVAGPATANTINVFLGSITLLDEAHIDSLSVAEGTVNLRGISTEGNLSYLGDGTINLTSRLIGDITNDSGVDNTGSVYLFSRGSVEGSIGSLGAKVSEVIIGSGVTNTVSGDLFSDEVRLIANGTLSISGTAVASNVLVDSGELTILGSSDIQSLSINTGTVNLDGETTADIQYLGDGSLVLGSSITEIMGSIENLSGDNQKGHLTILGSTSLGIIGASGAELNTISAGRNGVTVDFTEDVYVSLLNISGSGSIVFADGTNLFGSVQDAGLSGQGVLSLLGSSTITGPVGSSSVKIVSILAGASGESVFNSVVFANSYTHMGSGSVRFNDDFLGNNIQFGENDGTIVFQEGVNISANITSAAATKGNLILMGDNTINGHIGSGAGLRRMALFGNSAIVGEKIVKLQDLNLELNTLSMDSGSELILNSGGSLSLSMSSLAYGNVQATNTAINIPADVSISINFIDEFPIRNGDEFIILDGGAESVIPGGNLVNTNRVTQFFVTGGRSLTLVAGDREELILDDTGQWLLNSIQNTSIPLGSDLQEIMDLILNTFSSNEGNLAFNQMLPSKINNAQAQITNTLSEASMNILLDHMNHFQPIDVLGLNSGDVFGRFSLFDASGVWLKGMMARGRQSRDLAGGYTERMSGAIGGSDWLVNHSLNVGLALGYADNHIDLNFEPQFQNLKGTQLFMYAKKYLDEDIHLESIFTSALNHYKNHRLIKFPGVNRLAVSDYHGQQYTLRIGLGNRLNGIKNRLNNHQKNPWNISTKTSIVYSKIFVDGYREKGANDLNLIIKPEQKDILKTDLGLNIAYLANTHYFLWTPEIKISWLHNYLNKLPTTTALFSGGGSTFVVPGSLPGKNTYNLGFSLTGVTPKNAQIVVSYDRQYRPKYRGESLSMTGRYTF